MSNRPVKFGLILSNTERSIHYFNYLKLKKLTPSIVLLYSDQKILPNLKKILPRKNFFLIPTNNINNKKIGKYVLSLSEKLFVFSGYPSQIIKNLHLLKKKTILHSHSGKLPQYKGSTTIFYSILKENSIWCSTFKMNNKIDNGKILMVKKYNYNQKIFKNFDYFDNLIRIKNICEVLKNKMKNKDNLNKRNNKSYYHVAHPILRCLSKINTKK
tara:strand:- start:734 stop:1375 length:642 start_codon:yes stop_codon:yes gene_type:complete